MWVEGGRGEEGRKGGREGRRGAHCAPKDDALLHVGVDNLSVVSHVAKLIDRHLSLRPFPLVEDGDLLRRLYHVAGWWWVGR